MNLAVALLHKYKKHLSHGLDVFVLMQQNLEPNALKHLRHIKSYTFSL